MNDRPRPAPTLLRFVTTPCQKTYVRQCHLREQLTVAAKTARQTIGRRGRPIYSLKTVLEHCNS